MEENSTENIVVKCPDCFKLPDICVCAMASEAPATTKLRIVVLQHPQEPKEPLSTAPLLKKGLTNCEVKIGLSWPNIKKVLGREEVNSKQWAVAYLGSGLKSTSTKTGVVFVDLKGNTLPPEKQFQAKKNLEGIIFLDGTWSHAKALWWRNAWLTKLQRVIIVPEQPSMYGRLRKEPRRECLSTLESAVFTLRSLGENSDSFIPLENTFAQLLTNVKNRKKK